MISKYFLFLILFSPILINCGGGGGEYFPPQIAINNVGLEKEELLTTKNKFEAKVVLETDLDREAAQDKYIKGTQYYYFNKFIFKGMKYIVAVPLDNFVSIVDSKGEVKKRLNTPRYTTNAGAIELVGHANKSYLAVYIDQQATSHSSTLYILNDKMEVVYKEHLLGALWMAREKSAKGHNLIVSAETKWIPEDKWISVGGPWRYVLFK